MTRLTSRSDGRGPPLSEVIARWAAGSPRIQRVWASPGEDIALTVELHPVADSEETLAVWMAHCSQWQRELQARVGQTVNLDWHDPDGATTPLGDDAKTLVYDRAHLR